MSDEYKTSKENTTKHISRFEQMGIYTKKCFRIFKYEKGYKVFFSVALIMLLICSVTGEEMFAEADATRNGSFAVMSACIWIGIFNSIRSICKEREILKREHRTGLHISAYVMAHGVYEGVLCLLEAAIVLLFIWGFNMSNFPKEGVVFLSFLDFYITFFLIIFSSDALGIAISSLVKNENSAMTVMPFALIIQLVMSGTIFELKGITKTISLFTTSRWGIAAICAGARINDLGWFYYNEEYDSTLANMTTLWLYLAIFVIVFLLIAILSLEWIDHDKR
ncbi:MAG: ABC transporter permease [Clostridia bacterium]|nr:ABC transporter permease [Clostridia bacterium]